MGWAVSGQAPVPGLAPPRARLRDSFRERHPDLRAFTCTSRFGSASRIDQVWVRAPPGRELAVLNAAVVLQWPGRRDHDPAIADLAVVLPGQADGCGPRPSPSWGRVLSAMQGPELEQMRLAVAAALEPLRASIDLARGELAAVCVSCGRAPDASLPHADAWDARLLALDHVAPWFASPDGRSAQTSEVVDSAHARIEGAMLGCIPRPPVLGGNARRVAAAAAWERCLFRLQVLKGALAGYAQASGDRRRLGGFCRRASCGWSLALADVAWRRGLRLLRSLQARALSRVRRPATLGQPPGTAPAPRHHPVE